MAKPAAGRFAITSIASKNIVEVIDERRSRLNMSRSKYASLILDKWAADGYPGVSEADRAMMILHGKTATQKPKKTA